MTTRRALAALPLWLAGVRAVAQAAPAGRKVVAISLVGDQLSFVEKVGGNSDPTQNRPHIDTVPLPDAPFDRAALQAIAAALATAEPAALASFLAASGPELYVDQEAWLADGRASLPAKLRDAVAGEHADALLLLTKWRGEAAISDGKVQVGAGKLSGLGCYRFARREGERPGATEVHGYIAPFVCARLSLIDLASARVVRTQVIQSATAYASLTPQQQLDTLAQMLDAGVRDAVARVLQAG